MRGQREMAVAVREPGGNIIIHSERLKGFVYESKWAKLPFLRGVFMLWDTLVLGVRTLLFSASVAAEEQDVEMKPQVLWGTLISALAFAILLFFVLPVVLTGVVDQFLSSPLISNVIEKAIRLVILVGYVGGIGMLPDVRRVFAYHGAEHKVINAYEDGAPLEVSAVSRYSTSHPRCGTSFLLIIVVVSFIFFILLGQPSFEVRVASRIVLVPIVAAVAYEIIKFGGAHYGNPVVKMLLAPGLALQKLTTREPTPDQLEVAIAALKRVLATDQESSTVGQVVEKIPVR